MSITKLLRRARLLVVALLLPCLVVIPQPVQAFDVWALLDEIASAPGVGYPKELPQPSQIKGVINLVQDCLSQPPTDLGLIGCVEKVLDDPVLGKDLPKEKIELAIDIYLTIKAGDYVGLIILLGKPLACIAANVIVGFDVCGAIDAIIAVGGAVVALVEAFVDGLNDFAEWVGSLLGGGGSPSGGGGASNEVTLILNFFRETKGEAFLYRVAADPARWTQHLQRLRQAALSTYKLDGVTAIGVLSPPTPATVDQALAAFIAEIGTRWDNWYFPGEGGQSGQDQLRNTRLKYVNDNRRAWALAQYNATDESTRSTQADVAKSKCKVDDDVGRALENWKVERGMVNPSRIPNNEPGRDAHCTQVSQYSSATDAAWKSKQAALKSCTLKPGGTDFDGMVCTTYAGLAHCKKALAELRSGLTGKGGGIAVASDETLCQLQSVAAGQDFINTLKSHDPKGRCTLQPGGKTVNCTRDLSVPRACGKAKTDYASDLAGNITVGTNKPIIDVTCSLQRDGEYSALVTQTAAAATQVVNALTAEATQAATAYNNWQTNPQLKIATGALASFLPAVSVSPTDPLILSVQAPTGASGDWIRNAVNNMNFAFGKLTTVDSADSENDGQNRPGVSFVVPPLSAEQQKQLDQIAEAIDKKVRGLLTAPPPPTQIGGPRAVAGINPADFASRTDPVGRLLARSDVSTRFTAAELQTLANLSHTRSVSGAFSYKALGAVEASALQKAQIAAQQLGLGSFSFGP